MGYIFWSLVLLLPSKHYVKYIFLHSWFELLKKIVPNTIGDCDCFFFFFTCKFSSAFAFREILSNDWCPIVKSIEKRVMLNNKFTHFTTAETLGSLETGGVADFFWEHLLESLGSLKRMEKHYWISPDSLGYDPNFWKYWWHKTLVIGT